MKWIQLLALGLLFDIVHGAPTDSTSEGWESTTPVPTEPAKPIEFLISGEVHKNGVRLLYEDVCGFVGWPECSAVHRGVCETLKKSLDSNGLLHGLYESCQLEKGQGNDFTTRLILKPARDEWLPVSEVRKAVENAHTFAATADAHYTKDVWVKTVEAFPTAFRVKGAVMKNGKRVTESSECQDRYSQRCYEFHRTLCDTMSRALNYFPELEGMYGGCTTYGDEGDYVVSAIDVSRTFTSWVSSSFVRRALQLSKLRAPENYAYYTEDVHVTAETPSTDVNPPASELSTETATPTEEVVTPTIELLISGEVYRNGARLLFEKECGSVAWASCSVLTQSICATLKKALEQTPLLQGLYEYCGLEGGKGNDFTTRLGMKPYRGEWLPIAMVEEAIKDSHKVAGSFDVHYGKHVWVKPVEPFATTFIVKGTVEKDSKRTTYAKECEDRFSSRCYHFTNTLCNTMKLALDYFPQLEHMVGSCGIYGDDGSYVKSSIDVSQGFRSWVSPKLVEEALKLSKLKAPEHQPYYTEDVHVTAVAPSKPNTPGYIPGETATATMTSEAATMSSQA